MATQPSQPIGSESTTIDPYETLGLSHDATATQIKIAYRKLALQYHPDRCQSPTQQNNSANNSTSAEGDGGDLQEQSSSTNNINTNNKDKENTLKEATDKFARIAAAYATLSDTTKKKEYDHLYKLGAFDNIPNDNSDGGGAQGTSTPQTNNYRYTENLSGGYYKPGYKPPSQSTNPNTTHPFSNMAANFTPAQQTSFAKQAEAAFTSMQSQDSFFDDLLYSPKSNIAQQHDDHEGTNTTESAAEGGGGENGNNLKSKAATHSSTQQKKKQTGIGYSFKPIGKHLSIHVPSRNEIIMNMTQAQMSNMMNNNNDKSDGMGGIAQGAEKHLFGTRVTFSENKTSGISSLANMATCGLATSCIPSSTCGADASSPSCSNNNNNKNNNNNNNVKGKEKKVISTTTRIAKGQKRIVKRTAHLYPNGTKEIVIEENGVVVRRYVEENPNTVNSTTNSNGKGENDSGENGEGSGESQRDDNETIPKTSPKSKKAEEEGEEEDDKTSSGGLQKEEKFTLLGLFKACYSPCSASG